MWDNSDFRAEADEGSTGGLEEIWARALAREKGYVIVDAIFGLVSNGIFGWRVECLRKLSDIEETYGFAESSHEESEFSTWILAL
jgi:hypothetical protein